MTENKTLIESTRTGIATGARSVTIPAESFERIYLDYRAIEKECIRLKEKLSIAATALKEAHNYACSCCDSSDEVQGHCQKAIKEIGQI
jgi:hypothetical protein